MPGENTVRMTPLNLNQHFVEERAAGLFGGLSFDNLLTNKKIFAFRVFSQFLELGFDREDLSVFVIRGLAGVYEIVHGQSSFRRGRKFRIGHFAKMTKRSVRTLF
ncbi:MAG: hypothetical protein PHH68_07955 [Candidatus Omnitrophica bacterium]|nr:hypothetical protein [Candidatus Omnitrophota bacterium]